MRTTKDTLTLAISVVALLVSAASAWFSVFRRGRLYMVRPSQIYIGAERGNHSGPVFRPKIYLRTTMFCSGKRGRIVESVYVTLRHGDTKRVFNIWVFGEKDLARGSAMFVGESGVASNHHFLEPLDRPELPWHAGEYELKVYANIFPASRGNLLFECTLRLDEAAITAVSRRSKGIYFDWSPEGGEYLKHIRATTGALPEFAV